MLSKIIHETKPKGNILKILLCAAGLLPEWDSQSSLHCVGPTICLWVSTDSSISPSFPTSNADASSTTHCYNIASKTHLDMALVARVSCQIGQSIPHLFYCCLIDFLSPRTALSTARTFICLMQCNFQPTVEKVGFPVSLSRTSDTPDSISLKIAPVPPHHDPAFRQLFLDLLLHSNSPSTSRGEHSPSWHTAVLGQWQSHEDKAKHGHWLTRTVLRDVNLTLLSHSISRELVACHGEYFIPIQEANRISRSF